MHSLELHWQDSLATQWPLLQPVLNNIRQGWKPHFSCLSLGFLDALYSVIYALKNLVVSVVSIVRLKR